MDSLSENPLMAEDSTRTEENLETRDRCMSFVRHSAISTDRCDVGQMTIDMLPDNVFLDIFDFYIQDARDRPFDIEVWITLVHVCRHWRSVVFESPLRLNLQLLCTGKTSVREMLDIWPPWPIVIRAYSSIPDMNNIVDLLKYNDRIRQIVLLDVHDLLLETISAALMQDSFPALTNLELLSHSEMDFVFSGGSAPLLQHVMLSGVPFPELPNFLSSSVNHLTSLTLYNIPHSGYISPEAMVTCISALISLEALHLEFRSPHFLPDWESRRPRLPTRSVQPALHSFTFSGVSEYLEDFVARIDVPQLDYLSTTFFDEITFDTSQLIQFIYRKTSLKALVEARVQFFKDEVWFIFSSQTHGSGGLSVQTSCRGSYWKLSIVVQVCTSLSRPLPSVESLYISDCTSGSYQQNPDTQDDVENADQEWLDLLRPFTAVKDIYLSETSAQHIAVVLQELVEGRLTEVLPKLQNIFLEAIPPSGLIQKGIVDFVAARELSGHPIAVSRWPTAVW
jgi:hypothetical protein